MGRYSYAIVKENYPDLAKERTLFNSEHKNTKYALIEKVVLDDQSECITRIIYSNDLENLSTSAEKYVSWYNHPKGVYKNIQGHISELA